MYIEDISQNSATRQKYRFSAYLPHNTDIRFAIIKMDDFLSQETFDLWKEEIRNYNKEKRIQDNKQKWRTEKYQRKCEEIQAEKDEFLKNYM